MPLVVDFRDPWADRVLAARPLVQMQRTISVVLERLAVRSAAAVVVTTERFKRTLLRRHPQIVDRTLLLRNGFDPDMLIPEPGPIGRLSLLYAGTIYLDRNPIPLFDAIAALLADPQVERAKVHLKLVGDCAHWKGESVAELAQARGLDGVVEVSGPVSGPHVRELTLLANVIVNFAQGHPEQVPAKLYEQIASQRYGLLFAEPDSESAVLVKDFPRIRRVDDDGGQILGELRRLYVGLVVAGEGPSPLENENAGDLTAAHQRDAVNAGYAELLTRLVGR